MNKINRKVICFFSIIVSLSFSGCDVVKNNNSEINITVDNNIDDSNTKVKDQKRNIEYDANSNSLHLFDYESNKEVKKVELDKTEFSKEVFKFDDGYAAIVYKGEIRPKVINSEFGYSIIYPEKISNMAVKLYDKELNFIKEEDITEGMENINVNSSNGSVISNNGEMIVYNNENNLTLIDLKNSKNTKIFDNTNELGAIGQVKFNKDDNSLVFFGNRDIDNEFSSIFGIMNLKGEIEKEVIVEKYEAIDIYVNGDYAILNDNVKPETKESSGKVPVMNLLTKELKIINVDNEESAKSFISNNGKYIISAKEINKGEYKISQYSIDNEKVIKSDTYKIFSEEIRLESVVEINNNGEFHLLFNDNGKYSYEIFKCEDN